MKAGIERSKNSFSLVIAALAFLIFSGAVWSEPFWTTLKEGKRKQPISITNETFSQLAEQLKPAVVNISTTMVVKGQPFFGGRPSPFGEQDPFREFWEKFFGGQIPQERETRSLGSGFIINGEGYIVTNNHVVENAKEIIVTLHNEKDYKAEVIGKDKKTDLALIKIEVKEDLPVAPLGDSDKLGVGEWVMAIGNPFGLAETVTAGIVSAKGRVIGAGPYDDFIQTDASINPGNSGGPLFNFWGEVVGINTAIIAAGQGIGFAIPINMAKELLPQLKEKGRVTRGWLGVLIQRVTPQLAESFGLEEERGALVSQVLKDGPAEKAGIKQGDVVLEFDGKEIKEFGDLSRIVASTPVGKTVTIKVFRNGEVIPLQATVTEMEEPREVAKAPSRKPFGLTVQNITPEIARSLGLEGEMGVVVTSVEPGSPAAKAGIRRGDVIQEVNRKSIKDADDFGRVVETAKDQGKILFLIRREGSNLFIVVTPE
ncbi:MAG: Do family serine endopeptidase [Proteobacteria bacterium]|nr:Do family serine endopeptidase [Pseudomonadota bacterium]NIS67566.1 Do family serine endopeptidase [Pseudomonadota bacterium]